MILADTTTRTGIVLGRAGCRLQAAGCGRRALALGHSSAHSALHRAIPLREFFLRQNSRLAVTCSLGPSSLGMLHACLRPAPFPFLTVN